MEHLGFLFRSALFLLLLAEGDDVVVLVSCSSFDDDNCSDGNFSTDCGDLE